jgi:hypothetical protein
VIAILSTAALAFAIVLTAMLVLMGVCLALRSLSLRSASAPLTAVPGGEPAIDPRTMAVIVAAVAEAIRRPVVIHRVHVHRDGEADRWSRAGRMDVMVSHRVGPSR